MKMNRIASLLLTAILLVLLLPASLVWAADITDSGTCGENLTWTLDSDGTLTISGEGEMYNSWDIDQRWDNSSVQTIVIEEGVTGIGEWAFSGCSSLTFVTIPDSVTIIGGSAFSDCGSLISLMISEGVTGIGEWAFSGCSSLTSVTIPDSMTDIGVGAFYGCSSLESVTIPGSVNNIGNAAFYDCGSLISVMISEGVTSIGDSAFDGCSNLTSVTIPDSVTSIGDWAFYGCSSLTSVTIPEGVTSIGDYAFYECSNLASVTLMDGVTSIGNSAFSYCSSLESVTIPGSVASLGYMAFSDCSNLASVTLMEGVTSIGDSAFGRCSSLTSVTIPDSVISFGVDAFSFCGLTSVTIPDGVISIGEGAFGWCVNLTSVTISGSVTSIGAGAFQWCSSLTSLLIPDSVTSIGDAVFSGCTELTELKINENNPSYMIDVYGALLSKDGTRLIYVPVINVQYEVPEGVTTIGEEAFSCCENLSLVLIPDSVTAIGENAFIGCDVLEDIQLGENNLSYMSDGNGALLNKEGTLLICVPAASGQYVIPEGVTTIGEDAFSSCKNLLSVLIPDSVTSIGEWAFYGCSSLETVTIPNAVTSIGEWTFSYCSSLTAVTIPESVVSIGMYAFYECDSLDHVLYKGTNSSWSQLNVDWGNDLLLDAVVHVDATGDEIVNSVCTICNLAHEHSYFDTVTAPTCTEAGYTTYTCACGDSYVADQVSALGHTEVKDTGKEATCTATGLTEGAHCSTCGAVLVAQETTPVKEHTYDNGKVTTEPTEESAGIRTYTCTVCGAEKTETIPALEHTHSYTSKITAPTCEKAGYTTYTCSCGDSYTADEVAALVHDTVIDEGKEATCTEGGLTEGSHCGRCKEVLVGQEVISATDHSWDDGVITTEPTENSDGIRTYTCTVCSAEKTETIPALEHTHSYTPSVTAPICTEEGYTTYTCSCGDSYTAERVAALGHDVIIDEAEPPTCGWFGLTEGSYCGRCGIVLVEQQIIPPTEHSWGQWVETVAPDATNDGVNTRMCTVCGETETEVVDNNIFTDVKKDRFEEAILWAYYNGITTGTGDGTTFSPENTCTRKQIVTFLWRAAGEPEPKSMENPFVDVKADRFEKAILWAYYEGITTGTGDGTTFSPENTCTRKQIVTFLWRYHDEPAPESMENNFKDVKNDRFAAAILWAAEQGITTGTGDGTTFSPESPCTRKQIVTFLYRDLAE